MEISELMINDWVICHHPTEEPKYGRVNVDLLDLMQRQSLGFVDRYSPLRRIVKPIPLTTEILEKNGFKQKKNIPFRFFSDKEYESYDIGVDFTIKGFTFWKGNTMDIVLGNGSRITRIPCYVHKLQHALRLLGIDKEILL